VRARDSGCRVSLVMTALAMDWSEGGETIEVVSWVPMVREHGIV
jgi:hypothetical protein